MLWPAAMMFWIDSSSPPFGPVVGAPRFIQSDHSQVIIPGQVGGTGLVVVGCLVVVETGVVVGVVVVVVGEVVNITGVSVGGTGVVEVVGEGIVVWQFTFLQHSTFIS